MITLTFIEGDRLIVDPNTIVDIHENSILRKDPRLGKVIPIPDSNGSTIIETKNSSGRTGYLRVLETKEEVENLKNGN